MRIHKRILSVLLAAVMLVGMLPAMAYNVEAAGTTYEIRSFADLKYLVDLSKTKTFEGDTIELLADITLTDEDRAAINKSALSFGSYAAVGSSVPFSGTFKGNGHTISGLNYDASLSVAVSTALFSYTKNATIQDLIISDSTLDADMLGGILIGYAEDTTVVNTAVSGCDLSVNCVDNVLTLITDGGMVGGGLIGKTKGGTLYNCEVSGTYVHTAATGAVQALGGKGLYLGALVGSATGTTIEYSRVINGSRVKNSYDIAVGALGGNKIYAGGIAGEIKNGTKIIDSFSTAELYTYCATYVSVGAGNIGYVGGIAAASYGNNEITRCHYAGNATSKQYNAAIVIPIIQKNKNVSGISERIKDGTLTVTGSYFRPSDSPETSMKVLGDTTSTTEYAPQDDVTYADRSFWAGHDYDFTGTVSRTSSYSTDHANKWVMDYELGIPVHGQSVAAGFDFPNAGSVTIGATDLVNTTVTTDNAYDFAVQGFKPTTTSYAVDLSAETKDGYRFVEWYRISDVTADSAPEGHEYFAALMEQGESVAEDAVYSGAECVDNDLFLAHMEALVQFHDINGDVIDTTGQDYSDGADSTADDKNWYDFEQALPAVTPTSHVPESETARLIGWTTEKSDEAGGGYSSITNDALTKLRLAGSFYQTGDAVTKSMDLYPVYADLVSNVITIHEGNEQDEIDDETLRDGVGITWVTMDENNAATIHVGGVGSTNESLTAFPDGYRFIGWYTDDGNGNEVRISQEQEYTLKDVDLTAQHTYTARFEYRVQFWLPQKVNEYLASSNFGFSFSKKVTEIYVPYETSLFSSEWESAYINSSVYQNAPSAASGYEWKFVAWTDQDIRLNTDGSFKVYTQKVSGSPYQKLLDSADSIKYNIGSSVIKPLELSGLWQHPGTYAQRGAYVYTDFPYSAVVEQTEVTGKDKRTVRAQINDGYNWVLWNTYAISTDQGYTNREYAHSTKKSSGEISYSTGEITWKTNVAATEGNDFNKTSYYAAHNTADVNFHTAAGELIQHATVSQADFPYLAADKPVTMTRRYQSLVFGEANNYYDDPEEEYGVLAETPIERAELGTYATPEEAQADGYYFVGWVEPSQMADYERTYVFDISNGESTDGAPQYISSSVDKAKAYVLQDDALVERTMELYPVYVPFGKITTATNLTAAKSDSITVPDDPTYTVTETADDGTQTITLQADMDASLPDGSGVYKLLRMTVSVDGSDEIELTTGDVSTGVYTYTPVEPGHSYLFTAYYQPYVVVFHKNGTTDKLVQVYNRYDSIRNTPLPTVQDENADLDNYLFAGWTEQVPQNGLYITHDVPDNAEVTYDTLDDIYHFVDDGTSVSHAMELWPVYINIRIQVNSNIDDELTAQGVDLNTVRKVERNAADSLQTKAVATEIEGYKFVGWYKGIPSDKLTDDSQYTADRLVSTDGSYHLTGDSPYEPTVYTARYLKVYKVVYHDQNGDVLTTEYLYADEDHPFEKEETLTDADGNPVTDESGSPVTVSVPYFPDAVSALHEGMTDSQVFETWLWIRSDGIQEKYETFCEKNIISGCIADDSAAGNEMHLYPVVWTMSAADSKNNAYEEMSFSGKFDDSTDTVSAYFSGDEPYTQPSVTIHVEKTVWTGAGSEASVSGEGQNNIPVTLYPDDTTQALEKPLGTENTKEDDDGAKGNATFYFYAALTIEKTGTDKLAGQSFLFTVTNTDTDINTVNTVSVTCAVTEDGTEATGSVTILLPAGIYCVTEDEDWAYRYNAAYKVSYAAATDGSIYTENTAVAVSPVGCTGAKVTCTNTEKSGLNSWLFDGAHKENLFD